MTALPEADAATRDYFVDWLERFPATCATSTTRRRGRCFIPTFSPSARIAT